MSYSQSGESVFSTLSNQWIDVDLLPHVYVYNTDGTVSTDTITDGANTWVKSYSYSASGALQNATAWVRQ